jgi:hypothetical protein
MVQDIVMFAWQYIFPEMIHAVPIEVKPELPEEVHAKEEPAECPREDVQSLYDLVSSWSDIIESDDDDDECSFSPIGTIVAHWTLSDEAIELL